MLLPESLLSIALIIICSLTISSALLSILVTLEEIAFII